MSTPILATKLYRPALRSTLVGRPRLVERLTIGLRQNQGFGRKLTLISAPAGFGKTTLVSSWIDALRSQAVDSQLTNQNKRADPVAWLSLDEGDNDPTRFLTYFISALQTLDLSNAEGLDLSNVEEDALPLGQGVLDVIQSPQPPPIESSLTVLLNEIAALPINLLFVLDDYHAIDSPLVDRALTFLVEHLPSSMHLVVATREDPPLPLARLRAQGQLTELRAADLRFTPEEAAGFLNQVSGLSLSAAEITALEIRTEGWIAGLQLAAISMQGNDDIGGFIESFTGSHHFVMDYLVEEVLNQQSASVQHFLLCTSILERLCGALCEAVLQAPAGSGQEMLAEIEQANLFLIPLDNERRWYRYHHLFADLLQQRLQQQIGSTSKGKPSADEALSEDTLHSRASIWFEENGLAIEAFQHAVAANNIDRAARLAEGDGMPLLFRGAVAPVVTWLESLPKDELDARPSLWVMYGSAMLFVGQNSQVEEKLHAAEAALAQVGKNAKTRDDIGHIATIRATLAVTQLDAQTIIAQAQRALAYLHPHNVPVRTATTWALGFAHQIQGNRAAAKDAYTEAIAASEAIGHFIIHIMSMTGLGNILEADCQLYEAAETYQRVLEVVGKRPTPSVCEAHHGLARIYYEWNDLSLARQHAEQSIHFAEQIEGFASLALSTAQLAQIKLAQGKLADAVTLVNQAERFLQQKSTLPYAPEIFVTKVAVLLHQGHLTAAAKIAEDNALSLSQARIYLTQGGSLRSAWGT